MALQCCTRSHLNFSIYEENFVFFFISVAGVSGEDCDINDSISDNVIMEPMKTNPPALWSPLRENRRNPRVKNF
jgi:hypothetical protein